MQSRYHTGMPTSLAGGRRFRDQEVAEILQRAGELQKTSPAKIPPGELSESEIEDIGRDVGIDPVHVRRAIAERARGRKTLVEQLIGGRTRVVVEQAFPGALSPEIAERMAGEIREAMGAAGQLSVLPNSLAWSSGPGPTPFEVIVTSRDGTVTVHVEARLTSLVGGFFGGIVGGAGGGLSPAAGMLAASATNSPVAGVVAGVGVVLLSFAAARAFFGRSARNAEERSHDVLARLASVLGSASKPG